MKTFKHIFCISLSLSFGFSHAQTGTINNNFVTDETVTINSQNNEAIANNTITDSDKEKTNSIAKPGVKVYPEPFSGIVSVNLSNCQDSEICVFDGKGKCLKYIRCQNEECAIFNLRNQPNGIYYMEIKVQGEKTVKTIYLKQNF
ncbi:MAG: hypothetical protein H7141_03600 [Burkholderiales bacterium]|nr:hypothetical protein [Bacteroidia bacterium]